MARRDELEEARKVSRQEYFKQREANKLKRFREGLEDHVPKVTILTRQEFDQQIELKYQLMLKELAELAITDDDDDDASPAASYDNFCSSCGSLAISP